MLAISKVAMRSFHSLYHLVCGARGTLERCWLLVFASWFLEKNKKEKKLPLFVPCLVERQGEIGSFQSKRWFNL